MASRGGRRSWGCVRGCRALLLGVALLPVAAGIETAECIAGARLVVIEGMGHDLPPPLLPRIADEIAAVAGLPGLPRPEPPV